MTRRGQRRLAALLGLGLCLPASTGTASEVVELSGSAFGTRWHVRLARPERLPPPEHVAQAVGTVLDEIDAGMSTWRDDSEIARFNRSLATGWQPVSRGTADVVAVALEVHQRSEGALDPTVGPLVELWGFGASGPHGRPPDTEALAAARARVGAGGVEVRRDPPALRKARPDLALDLSAVAKGHAADAIAGALEALGVSRFLVEVGGELRARGAGPDDGPWQVGIERPTRGATRIGWTLSLEDASLASAGDYRRSFEWRGRRYSHAIDPRSGFPIDHGLVSVSVLAQDAARADAWATALLVLGPEAGLRVAAREGLAVLFVLDRDAGLEARTTPSFERYLHSGGTP